MGIVLLIIVLPLIFAVLMTYAILKLFVLFLRLAFLPLPLRRR